MIDLLALLLGALLVSIGLAWAIGPARLLAGIVAVPIMWAIVTVAAVAAWVAVRLGGAP